MKPIAAVLSAALFLSVVVATAFAAAPVPVINCGQDVKGVGDLVADLDCSAVADDAVNLNGRLRLNGFTLTGNVGFDVVSCKTGPCRVTGPGTITGGSDGVRSEKGATVEAGAIITGNASDGVRTDAVAKILESSVTGNGSNGVRSDSSASITRSTITGNTANGVAAKATVNVNASVIDSNNGRGVDGEKTVKATNNSFIRNNGLDGLLGTQININNTTATGNGTSPTCILSPCADLAAPRKPSVRGSSTCETSRNTVFGGTWLVCSND
ncbi:MAG: hypothetical protein U1E51_27360 [Candidatus Binatia bacterium]|nr:hypothetical protein [Candidatus Binatia bacterium]